MRAPNSSAALIRTDAVTLMLPVLLADADLLVLAVRLAVLEELVLMVGVREGVGLGVGVGSGTVANLSPLLARLRYPAAQELPGTLMASIYLRAINASEARKVKRGVVEHSKDARSSFTDAIGYRRTTMHLAAPVARTCHQTRRGWWTGTMHPLRRPWPCTP